MTGRRVAVRSRAQARPIRPVRRASAGLTPVRAAAIAWLLIDVVVTYALATTSAFGFRDVDLGRLSYTDPAAVRAALALSPGTNLFGLATDELAGRLRTLPPVAAAGVSVALPGTVVIHVVERTPLLLWAVGATRYLVDRQGVLFGVLGPAPVSAVEHLPAIEDRRADSPSALSVGARIDAVDLDAAARLASLSPADVGSAAGALSVSVGDDSGFVLRASGGPSWTAIFGFYTPTLRTTDLIPGQVRLLRSLLAGREATVARVILADATNGTYVAKSPAPSR